MSLSRSALDAAAPHIYQSQSNDAIVRVASLPQQNAVSFTLVQAALALVLAKHANSAEVLLGIGTIGEQDFRAYQQQRQRQRQRQQGCITFSNVVPTKIPIDQSERVSHYLERVHTAGLERATELAEFFQLSDLDTSTTDSHDYNFQVVLIEQYWDKKAEDKTEEALNEFNRSCTELSRLSNLDIHCYLVDNEAHLVAHFDSKLTSSAEIKHLLDVWQHVLRQLGNNIDDPLISLIDYVPPSHMDTILLWNSDVPDSLDTCVHDLVYEQVMSQPHAPAICSWDGNFTYSEVDMLSTTLANHLAQLAVGPEVFVAYCFEKSAWAVVSMLAIIKAGGAFVAIDPKNPESRIKTILQASKASIVLTSSLYSHLFQSLEVKAVQVNADSIQSLPGEAQEGVKPRSSTPRDAVYMINTSGSTGVPKSIIVEHGALSSALPGLASISRMSATSRVLQFAAYTFDVSIDDVFTTLSYGGCICIPSEHERLNDLAASIVRMEANTATLTPSVAQLLCPHEVPCLRHLSVGGESFQSELLEVWAENLDLSNTYGPSECVVTCAAQNMLQSGSQPNNIGRGLRSLHWIVDDEDHDHLCPIGFVGELLIEGPVLARCYTNPEQTKSSFIENPLWAKLEPGARRRFYKTGDLVKYNPDGTMVLIGRKDSQVKIRGHRIELGEIEHHLSACDPVNTAVAQYPSDGAYKQQLVAVLTLNEFYEPTGISSQLEVIASTSGNIIATYIQSIQESLSATLPAYMIPQAWVIVKAIPLHSSGKLDRSTVKRFLMEQKTPGGHSDHETATHSNDNRRAPSTDTEKRLQVLWADVLRVAAEMIDADAHFFQLGGDSLKAMRLVALAHRESMGMTVASIFSEPVLAKMALSTAAQVQSQLPVQPFELVGGEAAAREIVEAESHLWDISWNLVQDIYPCAPLQAGLISLSAKNPGTYTVQNVFELPPTIDLARFKDAWETCFSNTDILRSIIIPSEQCGPCQIVLKSELDWAEADSLDTFVASDARINITYGSQLNRFALVQDNKYFIWTAHHASYDGVSMALILSQVEQIYSTGFSHESLSIAGLVRHIQSTDLEASRAYWTSYLASAASVPFPRLRSSADESLPDAQFRIKVPLHRKARSSITSSTIIRAAWALVLAGYSESADVIFGATLSGRTAPIQGIDEMIGPTATTVPLRIIIDHSEAVTSYLARVQADSTAMMAFEHVGLQNIASFGSEYHTACNFQNLLVIQPPEMDRDLGFLGLKRMPMQPSDLQEGQTYPLNIEVELTEPLLDVTVTYGSQVFTETQVSRMMRQFSHVLQQLAVESDLSTVGDVDLVSPQDLDEIQCWNAQIPDKRTTTIPAQFLLSVERYAEAPAICAWDGGFTYAELDHASHKMAQFLMGIGVGPGVIVPACFDKSAWAAVAVLGIMRAGGCYVSLDPAHPQSRLAAIVEDVGATVIIAAPEHARRFSSLVAEVVAFNHCFLDSLADLPAKPLPLASPRSPAFILFTSGSTGKPKGIVIEHEAVCTSTNAFGSKWGIGYGTRLFQFAAYVFDVSVSDMFTSLMRGACVCIPSEHDRMNNTAAAINKLDANFVSLTPTVASLLKPEDVPGLRTMVLGGEAPTLDNMRTWADKLDLIVCYGPAEVSITCSSTEPTSLGSDPSNIGLALASNMWIVDPLDHNKLAPIGCVGEILVEGSILARGYLNDDQKTADAFIENPTFAKRFRPSGPRRFYKTGDLGYYNSSPDASISFVGRKDTQVKVHGQRVELGEIEHHIFANPHVQHVVATVSMSGPFQGRLVAMLVVDGEVTSSTSDKEDSHPRDAKPDGTIDKQTSGYFSSGLFTQSCLPLKQTSSYASEIGDSLLEKLPSYMIPSTFIFVESIPLNTSGKLNRKEVKAWIQAMDNETYQRVTESSKADIPNMPLTAVEKILQRVCGQVLKLDISLVHIGLSFLALGGDSITAMLVVSRCRSEGISASVKDILQSKTLHRLASLLTPIDVPSVAGIQEKTQNKPSSDTGKPDVPHITPSWHRVKEQLGLARITDIEAVYPCTPVQRGMLISHSRNWRFYEIKNVFEVKGTKPGVPVDADRLEQAWNTVVKRQPVLRTVFFEDASTENIFYQAVIREHTANVLRLKSTDDDEPIEMLFSQPTMDFQATAVPANQFTICTTLSGRVFVKVDILHALSDGTTWDLIFKELNQAYEGSLSTKPPPSYADYVSYLASLPSDVTLDYWKTYLANVQPCLFPNLGNTKPIDSTTHGIRVDFDQGTRMRKFCTDHGVTISNLLQTAWSLVLRSYVKCDYVCFGYVVSGRDVPLAGVEEAIGTYIGQLPCRIHIQDTDTVIDIARRLQDDYFSGVPNQHVSFVDLYHSLGVTGQLFNTNVHYMRVSDHEAHKFSSLAFEYKRSIDPSEYDVTVHAMVSDTDIKVHLGYWDSALSELEAKRLADLLSHALVDILDGADGIVRLLGHGLGENHTSSMSATQAIQTGYSHHGILNQTAQRPPISREEELGRIWADILGVEPRRVGLDAKFRGFGGDSYLTMKMMMATRESGFLLNCADALADVTLSEMASRLKPIHEMPDYALSGSPCSNFFLSDTDVHSIDSETAASRVTDITDPSMERSSSGVLLQPEVNNFPSLRVLEGQPAERIEGISTNVEFRSWEDIDDLLPTTPVQQAMLDSQIRSEKFYNSRVIWKVAGLPASVSIQDFGVCWQRVVDSHQILRTIFVRTMAAPDNCYSQLVLKNVEAKVQYAHADNQDEALRLLTGRPIVNCRTLQPAHALTICHTGDGLLLCSLSISHALSDAVSLSIMLKELSLRCSGDASLIPDSCPYSHLGGYVANHSRDETEAYWLEYLKNAEPCRFPSFEGTIGSLNRMTVQFERASDLRHFTKSSGMTASTIFRTAWALLLAGWTKKADVCFGHVVSGRDAPVPGIENIVGPVLNILPCRVVVDPGTSVLELLEAVQADFFQSLPHQFEAFIPAEDVIQPAPSMFNTLFNFRNSGLWMPGDAMDFETLWSEDPMEYDLVFAINERDEKLEVELNYWDGRLSHDTVSQVAVKIIALVHDIVDEN